MLDLIHLLQQRPSVERIPLGVLADFCPICRGIQVFRLLRVDRSRHLMGSLIVRTIGHRSACGTCGFELAVAEDRLPATWPEPTKVPEGVKAEAARAYAERIDLERRRELGQIDAQERLRLLREPFLALEGLAGETGEVVESRMSPPAILRGVGCLFVAAVLLSLGAVMFAIPYRRWDGGPPPKLIGFPLLAAGAGLLFFSIYSFATARRRFLRGELRGLLARALKPLAPTREELDLILLELEGRDIRRLASVDDLLRAV